MNSENNLIIFAEKLVSEEDMVMEESNLFNNRKKKEEKKVKFNANENPDDYIIHSYIEIDVEKKVDSNF